MADEQTPADQARLRRLLARSRHDEPVPSDVAARLDDVLARLDAGDPDVVGPRTLQARARELGARRRRTVTSVLVAAAAVTAVGVGIGQVVDGVGGAGESATTAAEPAAEEEAADRSEGRTDADAPSGALDEESAGGGAAGLDEDELSSQFYGGPSGSRESGPAADALSGTAATALADLLVVRDRLVTVPEEGFTRAAARLQRQVAPVTSPRPRAARRDPTTRPLQAAPPRVQRAWQGCAPTTWGEGTAVAVLYDDAPAVLVFRTPTGDTQVADLLQCGTGETLRSVTLPAG